MHRRSFILLGGAGFLAACASQQPLAEPDVMQRLLVRQITVDTSQLERVSGRSTNISPAQVRSDVQRALEGRLLGRGAGGGTPVRVTVDVTSVNLVSPGQSLLIGGVSQIVGTVTVDDFASAEVLVPETRVSGSGEGWSGGGVVGAVSRGTPEADYAQTVAGFANTVATRLLGNRAATGPATAVSPAPGAVSGQGFNADRPSAWQL